MRVLTRLNLDVPLPDDGLRHLAKLAALEDASLYGPISAEGLRQLGALPGLRRLKLSEVDVAADGLEGLAASDSLKWLEFVRCRFAVGALAALSRSGPLESLSIRDCAVLPDDVQRFLAGPSSASVSLNGASARQPP
jgi:hypothetical protein